MTAKLAFPFLTLVLLVSACAPAALPPTSTPVPAIATSTPFPTDTPTSLPTETPAPTETPIPTGTPTETPTIMPTFSVLSAKVNADQLACRYGPGWPYLYFFGLTKRNTVEVIGRVEGADWVYVDFGGKRSCWVNAKYLDIDGDIASVEPVYPEKEKLPVSPYYPPTTVLNTTRDGDLVTVSWLDIPLRAGDEEDERMNHYIIEVWRCEAGQLIFDPLATNDLSISFIDEGGCAQTSYGRVFVQEKHGFAGPTDIPWP